MGEVALRRSARDLEVGDARANEVERLARLPQPALALVNLRAKRTGGGLGIADGIGQRLELDDGDVEPAGGLGCRGLELCSTRPLLFLFRRESGQPRLQLARRLVEALDVR